ncbi:tripartite tricarboxylate transporter TctB family protein [uncultured Pseudokineococcus sp.]|uniref:tripartite tricarboxylate transporter TctB family protein n=1 Tax=uncultured Pseudokineococcus sp. TaxID=1642928 RepID=UPI00262AD509|nr:tripartite tricarboxylate transporter TctB family protein [uncultured Pseudokineococcus sp.]
MTAGAAGSGGHAGSGGAGPQAGTPLAVASTPTEPPAEVPPPPSSSKALEVLVAVVAGVVSLALLVGAQGIELRTETGGIDPRWWPELLGTVGLVLSVVLLATALLTRPAEREDLQAGTRAGTVRLAALAALAVTYVLVWPLVTFVPATVAFLAATTALLGGRRWPALVVFPVALALFLHVMFAVLLEVPL